MCGRFTLQATTLNVLFDVLGVGVDHWSVFSESKLSFDQWKPRYNISPTQRVPVIVQKNSNQYELRFLKFGWNPQWMKGKLLINARLETLAEKISFKRSHEKSRCLIPADGFYEWQHPPSGARVPHHIRWKQTPVGFMAGLIDFENPEGFVIITTQAPPSLESIHSVHSRMPVWLSPSKAKEWLHGGSLAEIASAAQQAQFEMIPVTEKVNSPQFDSPECVGKSQ